MSRYRKVEVRMWGDDKFRRLSPLQPSGQALWLYLICGPATGPIPGLFKAGPASMAEDLGWSVEAFLEAFREAFREGMVKADFNARVVWLPKAIEHNPPANPNIVTSWWPEFELIPECSLKWEALESMKSNIYGMSDAFIKAFDKSFGKALAKALANGMANQDQEQKQDEEQQEQEKKEDSSPQKKSSPATKRPPQLKRPDDVKEDTWNAFSALRKAKKAPLSGIALDRIRAEAGKAKITMDEALQTCCMRGWTGFKADWMHEDRGGGQRVNGNTAPNSYVGLSQKDYGKTRMGGFLERQMKAKLNGGEK